MTVRRCRADKRSAWFVMIRTGENIVDGIPVEVVRKPIRRINLRVTPDGIVRLSVPAYWATLQDGEAFLRSKLDWVRKIRAGMLLRSQQSAVPIGEPEALALRRLLAELQTEWSSRLGEGEVAWRLRPVKSFWGCCNWRRRRITYNLELARAPRELVEYVVVHELTHLQAHDHGPGFRALMDERLPEWRALRRRLNGLTPGGRKW